MKKTIHVTILIIATGLFSCYRNVDTFGEYCEYLENTSSRSIISFNNDAIRDDFVEEYNRIFVADIGRTYFDGLEATDSLLILLQEKELIGVTQHNGDLHLRNAFFYEQEEWMEFKIPKENTFIGFTNRLKELLESYELEGAQRCIFGAMRSKFDSIVIHGKDDSEIIEIPIEKSI
jgi:hypothetical protein